MAKTDYELLYFQWLKEGKPDQASFSKRQGLGASTFKAGKSRLLKKLSTPEKSGEEVLQEKYEAWLKEKKGKKRVKVNSLEEAEELASSKDNYSLEYVKPKEEDKEEELGEDYVEDINFGLIAEKINEGILDYIESNHLSDNKVDFCKEYIACLSPVLAYQKVFGTTHTEAMKRSHALMKDHHIQNLIQFFQQFTAFNTLLSRDQIVQEIRENTYAEATDFFDINPETGRYSKLKKAEYIPRATKRMCKSIAIERNVSFDKYGNEVVNEKVRIAMEDKKSYFQMLNDVAPANVAIANNIESISNLRGLTATQTMKMYENASQPIPAHLFYKFKEEQAKGADEMFDDLDFTESHKRLDQDSLKRKKEFTDKALEDYTQRIEDLKEFYDEDQ